jgi:hypothetical protein
VSVSAVSTPLFLPLVPVDLGIRERGDTVEFFAACLLEGDPIDLTGSTVICTFKTDLALADDAVDCFQLSTTSSGLVIFGPPDEGVVAITIAPTDTVDLVDDTLFFWDIQVREVSGRTTTVVKGTLMFVRDVTRRAS